MIKDFYEIKGVTGLVCKIDLIDSKHWIKFVAVQQNSATLIYDLNTMKDTVESYLKKKRSHSKQFSSAKPEKSYPANSRILKKKKKKKNKTVLSHFRKQTV